MLLKFQHTRLFFPFLGLPLRLFTPIRNNDDLLNEYISALKSCPAEHNLKTVTLKADITRLKFDIHEKDLREEFIKGFGPGG